MKQLHYFALAAAVGVVLSFGTANANPNMSPAKPAPRPHTTPPAHVHTPHGHGHGVRPLPPGYSTPRIYPPSVTPAPAPAPAFSAPLTMGAWVGYNRNTGMYSVAFDSPGVGGSGILIQAGYDLIILGPTTWPGAVSYLKSVGAPGW